MPNFLSDKKYYEQNSLCKKTSFESISDKNSDESVNEIHKSAILNEASKSASIFIVLCEKFGCIREE